MENTLSPVMNRSEFFRLVGTGIGAILLTRCISSCATGSDPNPAPAQKISFTLNWDDPKHANLKVKGGYTIEQGIIIAHTKDDQYVAVSAICTHQSAQLTYQLSGNQFYCPNHGSDFDLTGKPTNGPATQPLTRYTLNVDTTTGNFTVTS